MSGSNINPQSSLKVGTHENSHGSDSQVVVEEGKGTPNPDTHISLAETSLTAGEKTRIMVQAERDALTLDRLMKQLKEVDRIKEGIISQLSVLKERADKADLIVDIKADISKSSGQEADLLDGRPSFKADISKSSGQEIDLLEHGRSGFKADITLEQERSGYGADINANSGVKQKTTQRNEADTERGDGNNDQEDRKHVERDSSTMDQLQNSPENMDGPDTSLETDSLTKIKDNSSLNNELQAGKKTKPDLASEIKKRPSLQSGGKDFLDPGSACGVNSVEATPWTPNVEARKVTERRWKEAVVSLAFTPAAQEQTERRLRKSTMEKGEVEENPSTPFPSKGGRLKGDEPVSSKAIPEEPPSSSSSSESPGKDDSDDSDSQEKRKGRRKKKKKTAKTLEEQLAQKKRKSRPNHQRVQVVSSMMEKLRADASNYRNWKKGLEEVAHNQGFDPDLMDLIAPAWKENEEETAS